MNNSLLDFLCLPMLLAGLLVFIAGDFVNLGHQAVPTILVWPIQYQDAALILVLSAWPLSGCHRRARILPRSNLVLLGLVIATLLVVGILNGNKRSLVALDVRIWLWVVGGAAFFRVLAAKNCTLGGLCATAILLGLMMHLGATHPMDVYQSALGLERNYDSHVFNYSLLLSIIIPLLLILGASRSWLWVEVGGFLILLIMYDGVILGATRSIGISVGVLIVFTIASLWKLSLVLSNNVAARRRTRLAAMGMLFTFVLLVLISRDWIMPARSAMAERLNSVESENSNQARIQEAKYMIRSFSREEWLLGRGFGGQTQGVSNLYMAYYLHIGILTFLLKGGLVLLSIVFAIFYVVLPWRYATAFRKNAGTITSHDMGILFIMPGLAAWLAMLSISGGYSIYAAFGIGVCLAAYPAWQGTNVGMASTRSPREDILATPLILRNNV